MSILTEQIKQEHTRAELERLSAGYDGCGCADCQALYATLDLAKYGNRVIRMAGSVTITAGRAGANLWDKYHNPDYWEPGPAEFFITGGQKYGVKRNGAIYCSGPVVEPVLSSVENRQEGVTKIPDKEIIPTRIMLQPDSLLKQPIVVPGHRRGRPPKAPGETITRMTKWRREQKAKQLEMALR